VTLSQLRTVTGHFTEYKGRLTISYQSSGNDARNSGSLTFAERHPDTKPIYM